MKKYKLSKIIVPWDFSDLSVSALETALELTESPSKIDVIHVAQFPSPNDPGLIWGTVNMDTIAENLRLSFGKALSDKDWVEASDLNLTIRFGDPGSEVARFAKEVDAGLIVISSHGHTGITRLFLGSVAERVVRLAPCPVLVLRGDDEE